MTDLSTQDYPLLDYLMDANRAAEGWQSLLDKFLEHFNLRHINLYMVDSKSNVLFQERSGVQPSISALKDYLENIIHQDKIHQTILVSPECTWVTGNLEPYQSMLNAMPLYKKWTVDYNLPYTTGCVLYRGHQGQCQVTFQRGIEHGPFTQEEEKRFTKVSTYLAKAVQLRVKITDQGKNNLRLKSVLNKFRLPVTAVNEFGDIIAHNDAMATFLQTQSTLRIENSQLVLSNSESDRLLKHSMMKSIAKYKTFESMFDAQSRVVNVSIDGRKFAVGSCELTERSTEGDHFSGALLYVVSPELQQAIKPSQLKVLFGFTVAEALVCSLFAQNMTLKEIAALESKSVNTVREQLQNCYLKTNTGNQLELMSLLSVLPAE